MSTTRDERRASLVARLRKAADGFEPRDAGPEPEDLMREAANEIVTLLSGLESACRCCGCPSARHELEAHGKDVP